MPVIRVNPQNIGLPAAEDQSLLDCLVSAGIILDAPCGGNGSCGRCRVTVDGKEILACQTQVDRDMTVQLPQRHDLHILHEAMTVQPVVNPRKPGNLLAFDIGTTSVVCYLLDGNSGIELAKASALNPQRAYGADVISRIRAALAGRLEHQSALIRESMTDLIREVCNGADIPPETVSVVSVVGNPAMQQLFLGISPENLAAVPFAPVLTKGEVRACAEYLPICPNAELLVVPDISGYVGADTMGCLLSTGIYKTDALTLLVDIGTNGEMVLGNRERLIACATAAGPALEGANITFGMRGENGAIDHVWIENGRLSYSVLGDGEAMGICGSGLLDAVAAALELGLLNKRGRIQNHQEKEGQRVIYLTDRIYLTQEDIRQVQLAKGAIHAGIQLMARQLGISLSRIDQVLLAGAFGTFLDPQSACRVGLLPEELAGKITAVGNAAGGGAKILALDRDALPLTEKLTEKIEFLELASLAAFPKTFAKSMLFREENL